MNYLPFAGYAFYGANNAEERAAYFSSWGLLDDAPLPSEESVASKKNCMRALLGMNPNLMINMIIAR